MPRLAACLLLFFTVLLSFATPASAEMRGAWVASVHNLNFPSRAGLSPDAQRAEIRRIVSLAASCRLNSLMVQVRPEGDALYRSRLEPWSRFLSGTQGVDPGYDPLATFIAEGQKQGIAIHAWINPYRAATGKGGRAENHVTRTLPGAVRKVGSMLWMDPGEPAVRQHVVRVVEDIVRRYAVGGVILDDYFYPYPGTGLPRGTFPDDTTFGRYQAGGGRLNRADWRRENVNTLIRELHTVVHANRKGAWFGVSPFGIYRPNVPRGVEAQLDQLTELYSDPLAWLREGSIDYLSPQLYWTDAGPQSFSSLLRWWRSPEVNPRGILVFPSLAVDRLGGSHNWPVQEISRQLDIEASIRPKGGFIIWSMSPLMRNAKGVNGVLQAR
jgi:uncharacterized lipoprotein YddW (UPF0748 family)